MKRLQRWAGRELWLWLAMMVPAIIVTSLSMLLLRPDQADLSGLAGLAVAVLVCGICWSRFAPSSLQRIPMLSVLNLLALTVGGLGSSGRASAYTGFFLVTFCFVGLTRPRGTSLLLVPFAVPGWLLDSAPVTSTTLAKLPVAVGCWALVGELIASYRAQQQKVQADLEHQLERDTLTGLNSRWNLDARLDALSVGDTVVFVDIDHFKRINDSQGHAAGDEVLMQFASAVLTVTGNQHEAVRYGGEEILLLIRQAGPDEAESLMTKLKGIWRTVRPGVTFSAGICPVTAVGAEDALRRADAAMYHAKNEGRDRWCVAGGDPVGARSADGARPASGADVGASVPLPRLADQGSRLGDRDTAGSRRGAASCRKTDSS
jgi:diguanylate cyclase (GGDEF)-like protein